MEKVLFVKSKCIMLKQLTNNDVLELLSQEIALYPELDEIFGRDLCEHDNDDLFWEELQDELEARGSYCFTICDVCDKPMIEGYTMYGNHYCSDACLYTEYMQNEVDALCEDDNDECYYTVWYENSKAYKNEY